MASIPGLGNLPPNFSSGSLGQPANGTAWTTQANHEIRQSSSEVKQSSEISIKGGHSEAVQKSIQEHASSETPCSKLGAAASAQGSKFENGRGSTLPLLSTPMIFEVENHVDPSASASEPHVAQAHEPPSDHPQSSLIRVPGQNQEWSFGDSSDEDSSESESDSDLESSDDSEEDEGEDYELLDPAEQARILMKDDADEDGGGRNTLAHAPRTTNEQVESPAIRPDVIISDEMELLELGVVENVVETFALIKAALVSDTKVLASGSVLCLDDRTVIGTVAEPVGRIDQPRYSVAFNSAAEMFELGIQQGCKIFYPPQLAEYVFTQPLKLLKGSDASNIHDEEVGHEEAEFSDDETEALFKRQKKLERQAKRDRGNGAFSTRPLEYTDRSGHGPDAHSELRENPSDIDCDGPYIPLSRPSWLYGDASNPAQQQVPSSGTSHASKLGRARGSRQHRSQASHRGGSRPGPGVDTDMLQRFPQNPNYPLADVSSDSNTYSLWTNQTSPSGTIGQIPSGLDSEQPRNGTPTLNPPYYSQFHQQWMRPGQNMLPQHAPSNPNQQSSLPGTNLPPGSFVNPAFFPNSSQPDSDHVPQ